jgi:nitrate reductase beta subunit
MSEESISAMYRLLAIAKYDDRYVIPTAYQEAGHQLEEIGCSLDYDGGPGMYITGSKPFGEASGRPVPVAVETFQALRNRQQSDQPADADTVNRRVNLLNWDGQGRPQGLFPPKNGGDGQ